jgi:hypothetical protein
MLGLRLMAKRGWMLTLYMQKYDHGMSFVRLEFDGTRPIYVLEWEYLTALLSCPVIKRIDSIGVKYDEDAA